MNDPSGAPDAAQEQEQWLDAKVQEAEGDPAKLPTIAFSHIAPFLNDPDEESDGYFNLKYSSRRRLLNQLRRARTRAWFCGHYHRNAGGWWHPPEEEGAGAAVGGEGAGTGAGAGAAPVEVVVTGAAGGNISTKPGADPLGIAGMDGCAVGEAVSGMRVVRVGEEELTHQWRTYEELSCMECL